MHILLMGAHAKYYLLIKKIRQIKHNDKSKFSSAIFNLVNISFCLSNDRINSPLVIDINFFNLSVS